MEGIFEGLAPFINQIVSVVVSIVGIVGVNLLLKLKNWILKNLKMFVVIFGIELKYPNKKFHKFVN